MGVVYKLKQEVIDFIVRKKKDEPSLSCRKLVDVINAEFGLNVSKSSVNAVIKQFNLSNPVGRLPTFKPPKNFSIPQEKKNQLFTNVASYLSLSEDSAKKVKEARATPSGEGPETAPQPIVVEQVAAEKPPGDKTTEPTGLLAPQELNVSITNEPELVHEEEQRGEGSVRLPLPPDLLAEDQKEEVVPHPLPIELHPSDDLELSPARGVWSTEAGLKQDGLGLFMPLAALWDMEVDPILGEIIARHLGLQLETAVFVKLEAAAIIQAVMRGEDGGIVLDGIDGFLRACEIDDKAMAEWLHALNDPNIITGMEREVASHFETQLTMVGCLQLMTEENRGIYIDPSFSVCGTNVDSVKTILGPLYTTIERAVDALVTNSVPAVIGSLPSGDPGVLVGLYETMEALPGRGIKEIALLGLEGEKVFKARNLFPVRKAFIIGTTLSTEQLATFEAEVLDNSRKYYDPIYGNEFSYFEGAVSLSKDGPRVRAILLHEKEIEDKKVLLTNTRTAAIDIIDLYAIRFNERLMGKYNKKESINEEIHHFDYKYTENKSKFAPKVKSIEQVFSIILNYFNFFTTDEINTNIRLLFKQFCTLKGTYQENDFGLFIRLYPPENYSHLKELESILTLLNKRGISNHAGHRVIFALAN